MAKQLLTRLTSMTAVGRIIATTTLFVSGSALAHSGHVHFGSGLFSSFLSGIAHPMTGLDHLVMLIGVGFIAAQFKEHYQQYHVVFVALLSMLLGLGVGAVSGFATGIEAMILASVFVTAVAVYKQHQSQSIRQSKAVPVVAVMMVMFHGWAHGLEAPFVSLMGFAPGMLLSAGLLTVAGYQLGRFVTPKWQSALLAASGVLLAIAS